MTDSTKKKVLVIGAAGRAGRAAVAEAVARGHEVTALVRDAAAYDAPVGVPVRTGDAGDPAVVAAAAQGQDAVIASVFDATRDPAVVLPAVASGLVAGVGGARLVWVGLASVLPDAAGTMLMDSPGYPQEYRSFYLAHLAALDVLRGSDLDWVAISPSGDIDHGGTPGGGYRVGPGAADARVTYADLAVALVDEAVSPTRRATHVGVAAGE